MQSKKCKALLLASTLTVLAAGASCKLRPSGDAASETTERLVSVETASVGIADVHLVLDGDGIGVDRGMVLGSRGSDLPGHLQLIDAAGQVVRVYPVAVSIGETLSLGSSKIRDWKMDLDLWSGKTIEQLLGRYWGGTLGINILIAGAGVDFAINGAGVYLRNLDFEHRGLQARVGGVLYSINRREFSPEERRWSWTDLAVSSDEVQFEGSRSHRRRAWILENSTAADEGFVGKVAIERILGDTSHFVATAYVAGPDGATVYAPTELAWNPTSEVWDNEGSVFGATLRLSFTGQGPDEGCYLSFGKGLAHRVFGGCPGYRAYLRTWCGPDKKHC